MRDSELYLTPCNNPQLNRYFERTVLTGIEQKYYQKYVQDDYGDTLHLWGITQQKGERHSRMGPGEFLLFYSGDSRYKYAAEILAVEQNQELIQSLKTNVFKEKHDVAGFDRWSYCIYLQSPFSIDIDSKRLHDYAGHSSNQPFGFTKLNKQGKEAIENEYGDIEEYLRSQSIDQVDGASKNIGSDSQFNSINEIINVASRETRSNKSTIRDEVSKLDQRDIPLEIIYEILRDKYSSDSESSILSVDAVGIVRGARLYDAGYDTIRTLADIPLSKISDVSEISRETAQVIKDHSQELRSNENTAKQIAFESGDDLIEVEKTLRSVGVTGVPRSEARSIVSQLHTHPSFLDIPQLPRQAAYYLIDRGYETSDEIARSSSEALTEIPQIGDRNVAAIQKNAAEFTGEINVENSLSNSVRLTNLDKKNKKETAKILGVEDIDSLDDEEWDAVLSHFFREIIDSPFDFQLDSEI
ncbi:helix-hairpin-helix domain-containing protein [Halorubrum ezzemoulense]|uniref:helix-hairpin-helix domain-containing protein n=1 Tax=Halorubrum ezzemoulense TaxID=337243 RepID=UPI00232AB7D2|nr:helix-hairpin-helix domain-containing protein [Halorubrum ezzemoulense]MDB2251369.1 helix-hairpin-helix domain-containing protein [Halorubrum ezzemoulense]